MKKDHVVVLLEAMQSDLKLVLESYGVLRQEMLGLHERLEQKIDGVQNVLEAKIQGVHDKLDAKIDAVEARLGSRIDAVAADLTAHRADTESHVADGYRIGRKPAKDA